MILNSPSQIFSQLRGFGEYGFPESHSFSFALLAYASAWLKHHEPAAFTAALLNSQPMGFYAPAQLVQDAQRHGIEVRPVSVLHSAWDCTLEARDAAGSIQPALRLGLRLSKGLAEPQAMRIVASRVAGAFASITDLAQRAALSRQDLDRLAAAGALDGLSRHRAEARWQTAGIQPLPPLLANSFLAEALPALPAPSEGQDIFEDYSHVGLTLRRHPVALLRPHLQALRMRTAQELHTLPHGQRAPRERHRGQPPAAGHRQRRGLRDARR